MGSRLPGVVVLAGALSACREPTQITVEIDTDVPCERLDGVGIAVGRPDPAEQRSLTTETRRCTADGRVGSLVAVPSDDDGAEISIRVVGAVEGSLGECAQPPYAGHCIIARRTLRYVPHAPLKVPITLRSSCLGVICDPTTTCVKGVCRPAEVASRSCEDDGCPEGDLPPSRDTGFATGAQSCSYPVSVAGRESTGYAVIGEVLEATRIGGERVAPDGANAAIVGFDASLATSWSRLLAVEGTASPGRVAVGDEGDFFVCGGVSGRPLGQDVHLDGIAVTRLGRDGTPIWSSRLPAESAECSAIATQADGSVAVGGYFTGSITLAGVERASLGPDEDGWVAGLDAQGVPRWGVTVGGQLQDVVRGVSRLGDGWVAAGLVSGVVDPPIPPGDAEETFLLGLDARGVALWARRFPGTVGAWGLASPATNRACFGAQHAGTTVGGAPIDAEGEDGLTGCFDEGGEPVWTRGFGGGGTDHFDGVGAGADGTLLLTGHASSDEMRFDDVTIHAREDGDVIVAVLDADGRALWARSGGSPGFDEGAAAAPVSDRAVIVSGWLGAPGADFGGGPIPFLGETTCSGFVARIERP